MKDPFGLGDRRILVTGGTRGIGRAVSLRLAAAGASVIANYAKNDVAAEALVAEADARELDLRICRADLTTRKGLDAVHEQANVSDGKTLGMVHCAATGVHRPFEELTTRHYEWTFSLNLRAFAEVVRLLLPGMVAGSPILAVSSEGAVRAVPDYSFVGASKGALEALARHLASELAPRGIRVNVLSPGTVVTEAWDAFPDKDRRLDEARNRTPLGRLVTAEEVAHTAQFLCSEAASGIVGQTVVIDGGARIVQ